jgi:DNA-binding CsgD family transcriptional regulator
VDASRVTSTAQQQADESVMKMQAPHGPLVGDELAHAKRLLTPKQLQAYRLRRQGNAWNWIADRMGVSRAAVIHHVAKAETRLGYKLTVAPKKKQAYKPVAQRQAEAEEKVEYRFDWLMQSLDDVEALNLRRLVRKAETDPDAEARLLRRFQQLHRRYLGADDFLEDHYDDPDSHLHTNEALLQEMGVESLDQLVPD